jgi:hypothetical protein
MSWGTCYSGSNNIHFDFPPIMKDGRNYANWQPGGALNEEIRKDNKIHSNWAYRKYLTENADTIIRGNQAAACDDCCTCPATYTSIKQPTTNNNTPFLYKSCLDNSQPFGYENSDLKNLYLSDIQLQSRMVTPVITQEQILRQGYARAN